MTTRDPDPLPVVLDAMQLFDLRLEQHGIMLKDQIGINDMTREILGDLSDRLDQLEAHVLEVSEQLKALKAS